MHIYVGFPHSSVGKESTCNARDPSAIPGSGRSAGEGIGYPLQYSWDSLVAQLVKNLPAMWETWVWSLGWEDPLEKGKATHSSILAWRIPWTIPWGCKESDTAEWLSLSFFWYDKDCLGFPSGSAGKESTCNVGDLGLISGLGRSPGEGKGYPLQYSGLENSMDCVVPWGHKESDTTERLSLHFTSLGPSTGGRSFPFLNENC